MRIFRRGLFPAILFLMLATTAPAQEDFGSDAVPTPVFAPAVFTSPDGSSTTQIASFALPSPIYGPFTMIIENNGVTAGNIELNETSIFDSADFAGASLTDTVSLAPNNTLQVEFSGHAGASLIIMILGYQYQFARSYSGLPIASPATTSTKELDWREKGVVGSVKDQGECGSDWAFSATGAAEGWGALMGKGLKSLSEQQLIDCAGAFSTVGCNGGSPAGGLQFIEQNGSCAQASYPYLARDGQCKRTCTAVLKFPSSSQVIRIAVGDEQTLAAKVAQQPVAVVLNGNWFRDYRSGIANPDCNGSATPEFAAALIVGFGETDAKPPVPFWLVKNSMGTGWGEHGYFKILRGQNKCGIADFASYPQ